MADPEVSYRETHEKFMQNHTGTSIEETIFTQTPIPFTIFIAVYLVNFVKFYLQEEKLRNRVALFLLEFLLLVFSQVLIFMSPYRNYCYNSLYVTGGYFMIRCLLKCIKQCVVYKSSTIKLRKTPLKGKRPYITYFRTSVNLTTTICILAVDFTSFPRSLAKTETYGFSLMDTGVGYFVVSNALVPSHTFKSDIPDIGRFRFILKLVRQNAVLFILGLVRFFTTESVDYQKHTTEYGVHWNFFMTLACTKVIALLILSYFSISSVKYLAVFIIIAHQLALNAGLEEWVLSDSPRNNFLQANREGITSILGYVGLYLASVELGRILKAKSTIVENDLKLILKLLLCFLTMYLIVIAVNYFIQCSRRLANITYIFWIIMLTLYLIFWCLLFEILLRFSKGLKQIKNDLYLVPSILESINYNALLYFLSANLLTGLVNLAIKTLSVPCIYSILIVTGYMLTACSFVKFLYYMNIKFVF